MREVWVVRAHRWDTETLTARYVDADDWTRAAIRNIAGVARFSSDRTIAEYASEIWDAAPCPVI